MKFLHTLFILLLPWHNFAGFPAGTLIKTSSGYIPIVDVRIGDTVQCCIDDHFNKVSYKHSSIAKAVCIALEGVQDSVTVSVYQHFYLPIEKTWKKACELQPGQFLLSAKHGSIKIQSVQTIDEAIELFDISIEQCHTYFVTQHDLLVHNFIPLVITLGWVFGGSAVEFAGASLGVAALGGLVGLKIYADKEKEKYAIDFAALDPIDELFNTAKSNEAQAPGKPTIEDGYEPPKNWDGKKVRNPNGPGYGWPDKKGRVWIPSGPNGHGGPHWDVEYPDGDYENIVPGGDERGAK